MPEVINYPFRSPERACNTLKTPVYILGVGVSLLRQYFGSPERMVLEKSGLCWAKDDCDASLDIDFQDNQDVQKIGKRPAVIVRLGDIEFPQDVLGDAMSGSRDTSITEYLDRQNGSWQFLCISPKPLEALALAGEIKYFIQTYRLPISRTYALDKVRVAGITGYQELKEYQQGGAGVVVNVPFSLQENFGVSVDSLRVSSMAIELETQGIF